LVFVADPSIKIARPSVASLLLHPAKNGQDIGVATGFVVERNGTRYLITNRHVVTGRSNDLEQRNLHPSGAWPDSVTVMQNNAGQPLSWHPVSETLYTQDGAPRWLEHPVHGGKVDVVALPLVITEGIEFYSYDPWSEAQQLVSGVSQPLFIIGFPFGVTGGGALGVWVQGTVATEAGIDWQGLPAFLVDSRTRSGQSGSPVIAFHSGGGAAAFENGGIAIATGQTYESFKGVYSGRINKESDLGIVWKKTAVVEIVEGGRLGVAGW
jgi:hypothetical protein